MRDILISGTTGYIGRNIARYLRDNESDMRIHGLDTDDPDLPGITHIQADITNPRTLPATFTGDIIHLAENTDDGWHDEVSRINRDGTENLLNLPTGGHFIHLSTTSVYNPDTPHHDLVENAFQPGAYPHHNTYGESKTQAEQLVRDAAQTRLTPPIILRPHIVYGPNHLLPDVFEINPGRRLMLPNAGRSPHTFTHILHLAQAIQAALRTNPATCEAYNIVDATPMTVAGAIELNRPNPPRIHGAKTDMLLLLNSFTNTHSEHLLRRLGYERTYNIDRARANLGYNPGSFLLDLPKT